VVRNTKEDFSYIHIKALQHCYPKYFSVLEVASCEIKLFELPYSSTSISEK
jgi:hypothetical protein